MSMFGSSSFNGTTVSRRQMLRAAACGFGGLALHSMVASPASIVRPSNRVSAGIAVDSSVSCSSGVGPASRARMALVATSGVSTARMTDLAERPSLMKNSSTKSCSAGSPG